MHIDEVHRMRDEKEYLMRNGGKHPAQHGAVDRMIDSAKDMLNTRANEETGTYYVKGKSGHSDVEGRYKGRSFGHTYDSDPNLKGK